MAVSKVEKSEEEWRAILSPEQFRILREKGTEYVPFFHIFLPSTFPSFFPFIWDFETVIRLIIDLAYMFMCCMYL